MRNISLTFQNPSTDAALKARDSLLAASLRDPKYRWEYSSEYPLVLSNSATGLSWCAYQGNELVAHANLWQRQLIHAAGNRKIEIGLVGNVATHPSHRGQGHMSALMTHLIKTAQSQNLQGLVLWSDLLQFYQNLGFRSIGQEYRFRIERNDRPRTTGIELLDPAGLSDDELVAMMRLRPKLEWTLGRSPAEFRALLSIPDVHLFARRKGTRTASWLLIGKGADMRGVIHEWGAISADELLADVQSILHDLDIPELLLLSPAHLHHHWIAPLNLRCTTKSSHHMALAMPIGPLGEETLQNLSKGFIWGLDSI